MYPHVKPGTKQHAGFNLHVFQYVQRFLYIFFFPAMCCLISTVNSSSHRGQRAFRQACETICSLRKSTRYNYCFQQALLRALNSLNFCNIEKLSWSPLQNEYPFTTASKTPSLCSLCGSGLNRWIVPNIHMAVSGKVPVGSNIDLRRQPIGFAGPIECPLAPMGPWGPMGSYEPISLNTNEIEIFLIDFL